MSSLFDILTMSDFFKIAKCTRFLWKCVSSQNHPKFDILVMSDFFKIAKCTKLVIYIYRCFWCNVMEFPKKIKVHSSVTLLLLSETKFRWFFSEVAWFWQKSLNKICQNHATWRIWKNHRILVSDIVIQLISMLLNRVSPWLFP